MYIFFFCCPFFLELLVEVSPNYKCRIFSQFALLFRKITQGTALKRAQLLHSVPKLPQWHVTYTPISFSACAPTVKLYNAES